jgi:hypothetical protein
MRLMQGTPAQFRKHVAGLWMIDRAAFRGKVKLFMFFTCPMPFCTGVINKVHITTSYERDGSFECLYCKSCKANLSLELTGFYQEYQSQLRKLGALTANKEKILV